MTTDTSGAGEGLMPCPFCGSDEAYFCTDTEADSPSGGTAVACLTCMAYMYGSSRPKAAEAWNRRAQGTRSAPPATACKTCGGERVIDSGGFTPWGAPIDLPCPDCAEKPKDQEPAGDEVERVAKALSAKMHGPDMWDRHPLGEKDTYHDHWREYARAAIAALARRETGTGVKP